MSMSILETTAAITRWRSSRCGRGLWDFFVWSKQFKKKFIH